MGFRANYWSCSKVANWLRGTIKPHAATSAGWDEWKKIASMKKIRFWLAEDGLDILQNMLHWPSDKFSDVRAYVNNRWVSRTHALTSHSLKRGQYHEFDTRMLHSMFDELINFVEIDLAWIHVVFDKEERKKYKTPWWRKFRLYRRWCNPEAGMAYLTWASSLTFDDNWFSKTDEQYGKPTPQAIAAQETMVLYQWWKHVRPNRPDAMEASGWSALCEENRQNNPGSIFATLSAKKTKKQQQREQEALKKCDEIEKQYDDEDTEMLIRLVRVRKHLWT